MNPQARYFGDRLASYRRATAATARFGPPTRQCACCGQRRSLTGSTRRKGRFICRFCNNPNPEKLKWPPTKA